MFIKFTILIFIILNLIYLNLTKKLNGDKKKLSILDNKLTTNSFNKLKNTIKNDSLEDSKKNLPIKLSTENVKISSLNSKDLNDTSKSKIKKSVSKINNFYTTQTINLDQTIKLEISKQNLMKPEITTPKSETTIPNLQTTISDLETITPNSETTILNLQTTISDSETNITNSNQIKITTINLNESVTSTLNTDIKSSIKLETTPNSIELETNNTNSIQLEFNTSSSLSNSIQSKTTNSFVIESDTDPKIESVENIQTSIRPEFINQFPFFNSTEKELNLIDETNVNNSNILKLQETKTNLENAKLNETLNGESDNKDIDFDYGSDFYPDNNFHSDFPKGSSYMIAIARATRKYELGIVSCRNLCADYINKKNGECVESKSRMVSPYCEENFICKCN